VHQFAQKLHHSSVVITEARTAVNSDQDIVGAFRCGQWCWWGVLTADACAFTQHSGRFDHFDIFNSWQNFNGGQRVIGLEVVGKTALSGLREGTAHAKDNQCD